MAGIRGGKTVALVNEAIKISLTGWRTFKTPNTGALIAPTYPMLRDVVLVEFFRYCPRELIKSFNKGEMKITMINGSVILLRSADEPDRLRGLKLHWYGFDEPRIAKKLAHDILMGRIADSRGCGFYATTPAGFTWIYTELYEKEEKGDEDYDVIEFTSYDNPYFPKEEIDKLEKTYTREFFMQEVMAKFIKFAGLVYKDFARTIHLIDKIPDNIKYYLAGIDWGYTNPCAIVIIAVDGDDNYYIIDEYFESGRVIDEIIAQALSYKKKYNIDRWYADPSEPSFIESFNIKGIFTMKGDNDVRAGINAVAERLKTKKLFVYAGCKNTIREFETYSYPEPKEGKELKEEPIKIDDHALDALRYVCLQLEQQIVILKDEEGVIF